MIRKCGYCLHTAYVYNNYVYMCDHIHKEFQSVLYTGTKFFCGIYFEWLAVVLMVPILPLASYIKKTCVLCVYCVCACVCVLCVCAVCVCCVCVCHVCIVCVCMCVCVVCVLCACACVLCVYCVRVHVHVCALKQKLSSITTLMHSYCWYVANK